MKHMQEDRENIRKLLESFIQHSPVIFCFNISIR